MINNQMHKCALYEKGTGTDKYGKPNNSYVFIRNVFAAIYIKDYKINESDPRYIDCTHLGLTRDKTLRIDQKIIDIDNKAYIIKYVNNMGRLSQLNLKEI